MVKNVLVIGGGGREHALAWKLAQSRHFGGLTAIPGNPGISTIGECLALDPSDISRVADFAGHRGFDYTIVGPEAPLVAGIVDEFQKRQLPIFGPSAEAALATEGSKAVAKRNMRRWGITTANFDVTTDFNVACTTVRDEGAPIVVKGDGLAAGKGVRVCQTVDEALEFLRVLMIDHKFGEAGKTVVIEDCLKGYEVSAHVLCDGEEVMVLPSSRDYKRVGNGDTGPNTGGMGAFAPVPGLGREFLEEVGHRIAGPWVNGLRELGHPYRGLLYPGLMQTASGLKTLEFNVRFGDPETQALLPLLNGDLIEIVDACINGHVWRTGTPITWKDQHAVCVVLASEGYPDKPKVGRPIHGIKRAEQVPGVTVFHAGTALNDWHLETNGGRVLNVVAVADTLQEARDSAYEAVQHIHFAGMHYRTDIAADVVPAVT